MVNMHKCAVVIVATGSVCLSPVTQAQEAAAGANALAASTTLSGYVSTSYSFQSGSKIVWGNQGDYNRFKLDVVSLTLASAQGEGEYAAGYTMQFWAGPDDMFTHSSLGDTIELVEATIDLRLPVGSGLDLKIGHFQSPLGYESHDYNQNAFYLRGMSYYYQYELHTGILVSYSPLDELLIQVGIINDAAYISQMNVSEDPGSAAWLANLEYSFADSFGLLSGSSIQFATTQHAGGAIFYDDYYARFSLPIGNPKLSVDVAGYWSTEYPSGDSWDHGQIYSSYALSEKTLLYARYEWGYDEWNYAASTDGESSFAVGYSHQLQDNVLARVEWMSSSSDDPSWESEDILAFNLVYSF